jgi:3-phenylpropionate/trans-cinnamate dioxygenase alpha subunit
MTIERAELEKLVDWEHGLISPEIFISKEIYQLELEKLFSRTWLFLAHDSMIPNPGDFFSTYMGPDPVIVARQKDGSVKAFLNVCRHRGMKVCRAEDGNTNAFMCTYHGWTYDGSGALVSVPNFEDAYYGELDMSKWGLVQVPQVQNYKGLIFGNFDETAPPLIEYLGDMAWYMDGWLDRSAAGIEVVPNVVKWTIRGNWKVAAEQFAGDGYHAQVTHSSSLGQTPNREQILKRPQRHQFGSRLGHGQPIGQTIGESIGPSRFEWSPAVSDYNEARRTEMLERLGPERPLGANFTVFPNFSGLGSAQNFRVWQPKGPNHFEIWSFTFVDKNAPEEIKIAQQRGAVHTEGAAGMVEIDDGENWNLMGEILETSPQARKYIWNYQMGLGHERTDHPIYRGTVGPHGFNEVPQRAFYRRYLEFLTSDEWPYVDPSELDTFARQGTSR